MQTRTLLLMLGLLILIAAGVVGFVLLGSGNNGLFDEATPTIEPEDVTILVARRDLPAGTVITDTSDLFREFDIPARLYTGSDFIRSDDAGTVAQKKLINAIPEGTELRKGNLGPLGLAELVPPDRRAYALEVSALSGLANQITPGDRVDVVTSLQVLDIPVLRPGIGRAGGGETVFGIKEVFFTDWTVKTVVQDVEVLQVLHLDIVSEDQQAAAAPPPVTPDPKAPTATPGPQLPSMSCDDTYDPVTQLIRETPQCWVVVLALSAQETEVVKYSRDRGGLMSLALRSSGDREISETTGATLQILVRDYGVPIPNGLPPQFIDVTQQPGLEIIE